MPIDTFPHRLLRIRHVCLLSTLTCLAICGVANLAQAGSKSALVLGVQRARVAVVNIHGRKKGDDTPYGSKDVNGMGTGVVIDDRGYIVTNYHVVEGVRQIQVGFDDDSEAVARLIAYDPVMDLALIKVDVDHKLEVIDIGNSDNLMPAETVVAVGNAYGYGHTVTRGIVSELNREVRVSDEQIYHDLIQTDASINPGNSGGPLLNESGEMIGINVAVRVGAQGIGFAIPVNTALEKAGELLAQDNRKRLVHGIVGNTIQSDKGSKFVVKTVLPKSAAADAGIEPGDTILSVNDLEVDRWLDVERAFLEHSDGDEAKIEVQRKGESIAASLVLHRAVAKQVELTDEDLVWERLGFKLESIPVSQVSSLSKRYRGGMKIVSVRDQGPAYKQGIRSGDILVGMHIWETISDDNIKYILSQPEIAGQESVRFYILRGRQTLFGNIRVASNVR